jgi:hypothetical protein
VGEVIHHGFSKSGILSDHVYEDFGADALGKG